MIIKGQVVGYGDNYIIISLPDDSIFFEHNFKLLSSLSEDGNDNNITPLRKNELKVKVKSKFYNTSTHMGEYITICVQSIKYNFDNKKGYYVLLKKIDNYHI